MQFRRITIWSAVILLGILLSSIFLEQYFFTHNQENAFALTADSVADGLLAEEFSAQLPGQNALIQSIFYWTKPELFIHFWPIPAQQRIIHMRYYSPFGAIDVFTPLRQVTILTQSTMVRNAHFLMPAEPKFDLLLRAITPHKIDKRTVGMMFFDVSWQAVRDNPFDIAASQITALVLGIPTSILLLCVLFLCMGAPHWSMPIIAIGYLISMTLVNIFSPWHTTAIQPTVQFVACMGLAGVVGGVLWQRVKQSAQTPYIIIGVVWILSTVLFFSPAISSDGVGYYAYIRSYGIDGDWQFANEFDKTQSPLPSIATFPVYEPTGYTINPWSIGPAIIWAPFWYVAHGVTLLANFVGGDWKVDGYTLPYKALITFSTSLAGLIGLYLVYLLLTRWFTNNISLLTTITLYIGSNWLYYTQVAGSYPHSYTTLFALLMVITSWKIIDTPMPQTRHWVYFGLSTGAMILSYWMNILFGIYPLGIVIYKLWSVLRHKQGSLINTLVKGVIISTICGLIMLMPQFIIWQYLYHSWFTVYGSPSGIVPIHFQIVPYLFGPLYGLLWWMPACFVAILGSLWFAIKRPWPGGLFFVTIIIFISYNAGISDWDGSGGFGFRRIISLMPFFAFGLATIFQALQRWSLLPVVIASIMSGWSLRIMVRYIDFKFFRAPDNFLDTLTASMLSEQVMPIPAVTRQIANSLFINQLLHPNWMGVIVCIILITLATGVFLGGRRVLPHINTTQE
ncbi:MAG: hypothetical protein NT020_02240 [Chloroflexales bacterium]|nr:hypothetical protein [Chloroflexales bacterium]